MPPVDSDRQNEPLVIGHRGASADHPENTLESFEGAIRAGADVIELDVRLSSDGSAVIMHDPDVSATTDGSGFVHELSLREIKRLDASGGRGGRVEVPTFAEALQTLAGRAGVDVEIKNMPGEPAFDSPREAIADAVLDELDRAGFAGPVLVSSFNWLSIEHIRHARPDLATGFLSTAVIDPGAALVYARSVGHTYVLPQYPALLEAGEAFVAKAHAEGLLVGTWTVDEPDDLRGLFALGVDAVATNRPALAVEVRSAWRGA